MNRAAAFGRAGNVALQNAFAEISYGIYKDKPEAVDPDAVVHTAMVHEFIKLSPGTHFWASFGHLSAYSSNYYTYMFDKVIAEDFFAQFDPNNPLAGDTPMR
jgi:thimet oligopeptidase